VVEPLGRRDRSAFSCGNDALDHYFRTQVTQDIRRRVTACYTAIEVATGRVAGYYTLCTADVPITDLSAEMSRRLPRYPSIPAARIGRLAVHLDLPPSWILYVRIDSPSAYRAARYLPPAYPLKVPQNAGSWMTQAGRKPPCELVFCGCVSKQEPCWIAGRSDSRYLFIWQN
jgi:hypothetical protein